MGALPFSIFSRGDLAGRRFIEFFTANRRRAPSGQKNKLQRQPGKALPPNYHFPFFPNLGSAGF
jgi:hypothetical protein